METDEYGNINWNLWRPIDTAPKDGTRIIEAVEAILREEINLAKPDDLGFLEGQVPNIAVRIVRRLGLLREAPK